MQAAVLRVELRYLDGDNTTRAQLASEYEQAIGATGLIVPKRCPEAQHVYHLLVVRSTRRDELEAFLKTHGIAALVHYPVPVHLQPAYRGRLPGSDDLLETERAAREVLSLPMYPELDEGALQHIVQTVRSFMEAV